MGRLKTGKYIEEAKAEFCLGTPYRVPADVVAAGLKSLAEWCVVLQAARAMYGIRDESCSTINQSMDPNAIYSSRDWNESRAA